MEPLAIIFGIMAVAYVCYLLGRAYFMTMPITVSDEEGTKIVSMAKVIKEDEEEEENALPKQMQSSRTPKLRS